MATRILVVDDKPDGIEPVLKWLRTEGYEMLSATGTDQVLQLIEQTPPDLIVINTISAGFNGLELCRTLRRNPAATQLPLILITNRTASEAQSDVRGVGANAYVTWPIKPADLRQQIGALMNSANVVLDDNRRLLDETCQAALAILPCDLAWLLTAEQSTLHSRAIATVSGPAAGETFLKLAAGDSGAAIQFTIPGGTGTTGPLNSPLSGPMAEAALTLTPQLNIAVGQLQDSPAAKAMYRALSQLGLPFVHFVPLRSSGQLLGMFILGTTEKHDTASPRKQQLLNALTSQAATVVDNARLVADLARREEQMKVEQSFRKMILDTMGDGLIVIDEQAIVRYCNNRLLRLSGYTRQDLYGNSIGNLFHPSIREKLVMSLRRSGRTTVSFNQQLVTKNGRIVPVLMSRATGTSTTTGDRSTVLVLADVTEQKEREKELERQSEWLRTLNRAVQAITSALSLEDVIFVLLQSAAEVVRSTTTCLYLRDEDDSDTFTLIAAVGAHADELQGTQVMGGEGIIGQVISQRHSQLVSSAGSGAVAGIIDSVAPGTPAIESADHSVIAVPLVIVDKVIGVLEVINKAEGHFTQDNIEILENLAAAASVAIENARLFSQTQLRVNELSTMLEASSAVSSTLEIGHVLELIARRLSEALRVARCSIATWDRAGDQLITLAEVCNAYWSPGTGPERPLTASSMAMAVLQSGRATVAHEDDVRLDVPIRQSLAAVRLRSVVMVPFRMGPTSVGMVELYSNRDRQDFTPQLMQSIEESILHWRENVRAIDVTNWRDQDRLNELSDLVMRASDAMWCVISTWDRREPMARALREVGFALWSEDKGVPYQLDNYPTMETSLHQGLPMVLYPALLQGDTGERKLMGQFGMPTGLIIPLLVRGEAQGLVKLLDVDQGRNFDISEIELCQGIANVVGNAIENAQLYQSLEKRANALQAAYDDLQRSDKVKDDLIQNLSHELGTPLNQSLIQLDLLLNDAFGPLNDEQRENMTGLMDRIGRVGNLLHDMVTLHNTVNDQFVVKEVRVEDMIDAAIRKALPKAGKVGLTLRPVLPANAPRVQADADRIGEVLDQLIDNAIKFSPKAERSADRIEIKVEDPGGPMVTIAVEDCGIGIPAKEFTNIFQRGYQIDGSTTRRFSGTGLGLSLARQIVEAHSGKIWVESTPGVGSQFRFTLPKSGGKFHL